MKGYLEGLNGKLLAGKMAMTFDTKMRSAFKGNAKKKMSPMPTKAGFALVGTPLHSYVVGGKEGYHFKEAGETEKAKAWPRNWRRMSQGSGPLGYVTGCRTLRHPGIIFLFFSTINLYYTCKIFKSWKMSTITSEGKRWQSS